MQYLVLENNFTALTVNSIEKNMPDAVYRVIPMPKNRVGKALEFCDDITMVVVGGIILNIQEGDLPPREKIEKYHMTVSRQAVFADHKKRRHNYSHIRSNLLDGVVDMSIFIINPALWENETNYDLKDKKLLNMPRYMNHRDDPTVEPCMGGYDIMSYGSLGEDASVLNYLTHLYSGEATPRESWAYCFDKLLEYTEGLGEKEKEIVERLGNLTLKRIGKLRQIIKSP